MTFGGWKQDPDQSQCVNAALNWNTIIPSVTESCNVLPIEMLSRISTATLPLTRFHASDRAPQQPP